MSWQELLSILTPVYPDEHTLGLLRNQLRTFAAFADIGSFAAWIMVTPAAKLATLQMFLDFELSTLPAALSDKVQTQNHAAAQHIACAKLSAPQPDGGIGGMPTNEVQGLGIRTQFGRICTCCHACGVIVCVGQTHCVTMCA